MTAFIYIYFGMYLLCSVSGLLLIKKGSSGLSVGLSGQVFTFQTGYHLIIGFCLYVISFLMSLYLIKKFALSYFYPIAVGFGNVLVCLFSAVVFKEHIGVFSWIGIALVCGGVALINIGK